MRHILLIATLLCAAAIQAQPRPEAKPYVRWWWPGSAVDSTGLDHNLTQFAHKGIGGVEITPIYGVKGNETNDRDYLSPRWMEAYKYTAARSRELGLQVDMNNGTGWPFGGPWITPAESAQKYLLETHTPHAGKGIDGVLRPADTKQQAVATLEALQAVGPDGTRLNLMPHTKANGTLHWKAPGEGWTIYALYAGRTFQQVKRAAPGGAGLVLNHYNASAVQYYLDRFDKAFTATGAPWPDSFFNDSFEVYGSNWDTTLLAQFERDHGYRLQDFLPEFAAQGADQRSARIVCDYRQTLAAMLQRNFTQPWIAWAHARGCRIRNQSHGSPGNIFDLYAAVDIPECESYGSTQFDIPGLRRDVGAKSSDADPAVLKFASSAANVCGKRLTSCETLTWLTEHFNTSLAQCKPEIDQILTSGVNHVYFHGAPYSPKEAPFPGWLFYATINLSPAAPLWRDAEGMLGYVERCQQALQSGRPDNDFLLYIPMEQISHNIQGRNLLLFDIHKMDRTMPDLKRTMNTIVREGCDADYISDRYIDSLRCEGGELITHGGARYRALILPDCRMIPATTLAKALELARKGATLIFTGCYPTDVPGFGTLDARRAALAKLTRQLPDADFASPASHPFGRGRILTGSDLRPLMEAGGGRFEPLKAAGCRLIRRTEADGKRYFISLLDGKSIDNWVEVVTPAADVTITDPLTGRCGKAATRPTPRGTTQIYLQLQPGQSLLLRTHDRAVDTTPWPYRGTAGEPIQGRQWRLDFPQSQPAIDTTYTLDGPQSWTGLSPQLAVNCGTGRYRATFHIADPASADRWILALGDVRESARVRVNGIEAGIAWSLPFEVDITDQVQAGDNRIEIEVTNLPANRIADFDRRGIKWRIFKDANVVGANGKPFDSSAWTTLPAGLNSEVKLYPIKSKPIQ